MHWEQKVRYASATDLGLRRENNEDAAAVQICPDRETWERHGHLFLVADGMGGHAVGELASKMAADTVPHAFFKSRDLEVGTALQRAIESANTAIHERGQLNPDFQRMGTTCTALLLCPQGAVVGHVGDSRVYRLRRGRMDQLTFDHSLQWDLLRQGKSKPDEIFLHEPRHVITRSLGPQPTVEVDVEGPHRVFADDVYVLCSDGLINHVEDAEIGIIAGELPPSKACRLLVNLANLRGGSDNVTVVVARVGRLPRGMSVQGPKFTAEPLGALNLWWLAGFWGVAIAFVIGVSLLLVGRYVAGIVLTPVATAAGILLLVAWLRSRRALRSTLPLVKGKTAGPYRSSSAVADREFLKRLAAAEAELQQTASDERWPIDWERHEAAYQDVKEAIERGDLSRAVAGYARAIDALMVGLQSQRGRGSIR